MPSVYQVIPETMQSVVRPTIIDIVHQMENAFNIPVNVKIIFPGQEEVSLQWGSAIDNQTRQVLTEPSNKLIITVSEEFEPEDLLTTQITRTQQLPIFSDTDLYVMIRPIYVTSNVSIDIAYESNSKNQIEKWRNLARLWLTQVCGVLMTSATYHYLLPYEFIELLYTIYTLKENIAGDNETFTEYLTNNFDWAIVDISTVTDGSTEIGVAQEQTRIPVIFDIEQLMEKAEINKDTATSKIGFTAKFTYQKPVACSMNYPISIHNQLLPEKYVLVDKQYPKTVSGSLSVTTSQVIAALKYFENLELLEGFLNPSPIIMFPDYDDFVPPAISMPTYTVGVFYALVSPDSSNILLNLNELPGYTIDPDIIAFIQTEYPNMTSLFNSIFHVELYQNYTRLSDGIITIDSNLNVIANSTLDLKNMYHIRFSLMTNLTVVQNAALERLMGYPSALIKIFASINYEIAAYPNIVNMVNKTRLNNWDIYPLYRYLTGTNWYKTPANVSNLDNVIPFAALNAKARSNLFYNVSGGKSGRMMVQQVNFIMTHKKNKLLPIN